MSCPFGNSVPSAHETTATAVVAVPNHSSGHRILHSTSRSHPHSPLPDVSDLSTRWPRVCCVCHHSQVLVSFRYRYLLRAWHHRLLRLGYLWFLERGSRCPGVVQKARQARDRSQFGFGIHNRHHHWFKNRLLGIFLLPRITPSLKYSLDPLHIPENPSRALVFTLINFSLTTARVLILLILLPSLVFPRVVYTAVPLDDAVESPIPIASSLLLPQQHPTASTGLSPFGDGAQSKYGTFTGGERGRLGVSNGPSRSATPTPSTHGAIPKVHPVSLPGLRSY
jgi:hypothetical protein